jgi:hypothetical protein
MSYSEDSHDHIMNKMYVTASRCLFNLNGHTDYLFTQQDNFRLFERQLTSMESFIRTLLKEEFNAVSTKFISQE